jgi:phospholipase/lecithinase/hemolysin
MKHSTVKILLIWLVSALLPLQIFAMNKADDDNTIREIVFFGDSLSDNGNLYSLSLGSYPKSPPYYQGRFSDGPTWAENVADHFKNTKQISSSNYALGGESVMPHNYGKGSFSFTFDESIDNYFFHVFSRSTKSQTLYVILIGANDYIWGSENPADDTTNVNRGIRDSLQRLIDAGGRNFLLLNMPDLSVVPAARGADVQTLQELTRLHNQKLANVPVELLKDNLNLELNIKIFDYYALSKDILTNTEELNKKFNKHITNTQDPCYTGGYGLMADTNQEAKLVAAMERNYKMGKGRFLHTNSLAEKISFAELAHVIVTNPMLASSYYTGENSLAGAQPCADPSSYLFWDYEHPTASGHAITSEMVIDFIEKNFTL